MALIIEYIREVHNFINKYGDPRVANWPLMSSPFYTIGICLTYVYVVKVLGPNIMKRKKPFTLRWTLIIYNLFQVLFNAWIFYEGSVAGWLSGYSYRCQPVDYSDNPKALRIASITWWYYISKMIDFLDTIFFVMRKKNGQIIPLHVIHHGILPMSVWMGVRFTPGGHGTFFGFLNTFVHVVMYSYYLLSAFGPKIQKYLWWKKYVTTIQMVQFVTVLVHTLQLLFIECDFPRVFVWIIVLHALLFLFLFYQFYEKTYIKKNSATGHSQEDHAIKREQRTERVLKNAEMFDVKHKGKYIN